MPVSEPQALVPEDTVKALEQSQRASPRICNLINYAVAAQEAGSPGRKIVTHKKHDECQEGQADLGTIEVCTGGDY